MNEIMVWVLISVSGFGTNMITQHKTKQSCEAMRAVLVNRDIRENSLICIKTAIAFPNTCPQSQVTLSSNTVGP